MIYRKILKVSPSKYKPPEPVTKKTSFKVFRYSFSKAIPIFFNRFKSDFILVWLLPMIDYRLKFVKM